jgi:acylphosphatase
MSLNQSRAEIIANGLVQGVGLRYFVVKQSTKLGLKGFVKNLPSGEVLTVVEGDRTLIEELITQIKVGPPYSSVKNCSINWLKFKNEFKNFEVRY